MPHRHGGLRRRQSIDHPLPRLMSVHADVDQVSVRAFWETNCRPNAPRFARKPFAPSQSTRFDSDSLIHNSPSASPK